MTNLKMVYQEKNRNNFLLEIEKSKSQIFKKGDKKAI